MTTTNDAGRSFRLTVLNPGGRDRAQDFSSGINAPNDREHAPVNFHAHAACTGGTFECDLASALAALRPVLLLLRGDFKETHRALLKLKKAGLPVAVSFKETGIHQIAKQLSDPKRAERFREIVEKADGCLGATPETLAFYGRGKFIPTPYPVDDPRWDFSRTSAERRGVFIGTREWNNPSRNHLAALVLAVGLGEPITVFDEKPKRCRKLLRALGVPMSSLHILEKRLSYGDYLTEMARHKIVLQADKSSVPGQVAGDALLCRMPCVGGDGAIERIAFPGTCGFGRSLGETAALAARLLREPGFCEEIVAESQQLARERLCFRVIACELEEFFAGL